MANVILHHPVLLLSMVQKVRNWGKYPESNSEVHQFSDKEELLELIKTKSDLICRGMGRSYGDASLGDHIISTSKFNRILDFDKAKGTLRCESGATFDDILKLIVPAGWFMPVTPGTKFVSIGGAIAADVHGKNHHKEGALSQHVLDFSLLTPDGNVFSCSQTE